MSWSWWIHLVSLLFLVATEVNSLLFYIKIVEINVELVTYFAIFSVARSILWYMASYEICRENGASVLFPFHMLQKFKFIVFNCMVSIAYFKLQFELYSKIHKNLAFIIVLNVAHIALYLSLSMLLFTLAVKESRLFCIFS